MRTFISLWIVLALLIAGCTREHQPWVGPFWKQALFTEGPTGPEDFRIGWRDGCQTAIAATSNHLQRLYYTAKMDGWRVTNDQYYDAWQLGFQYCHKYVLNYLSTALPYEIRG